MAFVNNHDGLKLRKTLITEIVSSSTSKSARIAVFLIKFAVFSSGAKVVEAQDNNSDLFFSESWLNPAPRSKRRFIKNFDSAVKVSFQF